MVLTLMLLQTPMQHLIVTPPDRLHQPQLNLLLLQKKTPCVASSAEGGMELAPLPKTKRVETDSA